MPRKLLIAVGVVVGLAVAGWFIASYEASRRNRSRHRPNCRSNLRQIAYACHLYAGDHNKDFPPSLGVLFPGYISDGELFRCPVAWKAKKITAGDLPEGATDASAIWDDRFTDYVYVEGLRASAHPDCVVAYDREGNHKDGRWAISIGGKSQWMKEPDFQAALALTRKWLKEHPGPTPAVGQDEF